MEEKMQEQKHEDRTVLETIIDRRQFTLASAMAILSGVAITITSACGGGSGYSPSSPSAPTPTPAPPAAASDKTAVIGSNHGHAGTITAAQLTAAGALSLNIQGSADHPHTVELTAADITSVAASQRVSKESSTDSAHSHSVTFN
jgi:hypothetical protein